jgi:hypothetical protein
MTDYSPPLGEFQPPDRDDDIDAKWDAWFDRQEKNGMAVISREDWKRRLDDAATDGYAEGRSDESAELLPLLTWAYSKLVYRSFDNMDDALMMDRINLLLQHGVKA